MGLFQRFITRSRQRVWAYGPGPDLPALPCGEAMTAEKAGPQADQHRARHSGRIVNRTSDLSSVRDGDSKPVLDLGQEDESNEGVSNDYVGNSNVSRMLTDFSDPVTLYTKDSQSTASHSGTLESDPGTVKTGIRISKLRSCKAQKTESESKRVELDAGEETGLPKGSRTGPAADILLQTDEVKNNSASATGAGHVQNRTGPVNTG